MSEYFTQYKPHCRVKILSLTTGTELADLSDDVVSLSTNKCYGRAAGTWQIMLTYKQIESWNPEHNGAMKRYHEIIRPDDVVTIELDAGDGSGWRPVMLGQVDRVSKVRQAGPIPQRQVKISGQDAGKILARHDVGWDISGVRTQGGEKTEIPQQAGEDNSVNPAIMIESYQSRYALIAGTAANLIYQLWNIFQETVRNDLVNNKMAFRYAIKDNPDIWAQDIEIIADTDDKWMTWCPQLVQAQGTPIWHAMDSVAHKPYNMLHTDTDTKDVKRFHVILERNPIDAMGRCSRNQTGIDLHVIPDTDIITDDVGICDLERINVLCYWPSVYKQIYNTVIEIVMADKALTKVAENEQQLDNMIKEHGYCSHVMNDNFVPPEFIGGVIGSEEKIGNYDAGLVTCRSMATMYWNWYKDMHNYESGHVQLHLRPDIRAGHCLVVQQPDEKEYMEYLIEQVSHQVTFHPVPSALTTLQVTRGQKAGADKVPS